MSDDDGPALLTTEASAALQEFFEEQCLHRGSQETTEFGENWNLSQFWYTEETSDVVCREVLWSVQALDRPSIACISCPSIARRFRKQQYDVTWTLFEYDRRFASLGDFVFYDYNVPEKLEPALLQAFDAVVADPPYLSEECLVKTLGTAKLLLKEDAQHRLYLLTGEVMKDVALREASLKAAAFRPEHQHKLGNAFRIYTSNPTTCHIGPTNGIS